MKKITAGIDEVGRGP